MIRYRGGDRVFEILHTAFLTLFTVAVLVPVIYVLKQSLDVGAQGELTLSLIPREFSLFYYRFALNDTSIWRPFVSFREACVMGQAAAAGGGGPRRAQIRPCVMRSRPARERSWTRDGRGRHA